ncbi:MAG TPA: prevent-host-death protein [Campylobacterales bacterium]|nr:prevent-host-death protein [Campylobacterales bacterium]
MTLEQKGLRYLKRHLEDADEAFISVRGESEFVVMRTENYEKLKSYELDIAYMEAIKDIKNGNFKSVSADEHIKELKNALRDH